MKFHWYVCEMILKMYNILNAREIQAENVDVIFFNIYVSFAFSMFLYFVL